MEKRLPAVHETLEMRVRSLDWEDPLQEGMATHSSTGELPGEFHGQRRLAGYSLWGRKESDVTKRLNRDTAAGKRLFFPQKGSFI